MGFRVLLIVNILNLISPTYEVGEFTFFNWKFHFPPGSSMGLFLALAIPLDIPNKSVYLAYNFEANYLLPSNVTQDVYPPIIQRNNERSGDEEQTDITVATEPKDIPKIFKGVDRKLIYNAIETKLNSLGYEGKSCLLRLICETALHNVNEANGVFGNIFHIVFTPSSSINNGVDMAYEKAEVHGATVNNCDDYNKNCTVSFLDLISWMESASTN